MPSPVSTVWSANVEPTPPKFTVEPLSTNHVPVALFPPPLAFRVLLCVTFKAPWLKSALQVMIPACPT